MGFLSRRKMVCRRFSFSFVVGLPWLLTYKQVLRCAVYHAGSTITNNNFLIAVVFVTSSSLSQAKNNNQLCCNTSLYSLYWEFNPATLIATKSNHNDSTNALLSNIVFYHQLNNHKNSLSLFNQLDLSEPFHSFGHLWTRWPHKLTAGHEPVQHRINQDWGSSRCSGRGRPISTWSASLPVPQPMLYVVGRRPFTCMKLASSIELLRNAERPILRLHTAHCLLLHTFTHPFRRRAHACACYSSNTTRATYLQNASMHIGI